MDLPPGFHHAPLEVPAPEAGSYVLELSLSTPSRTVTSRRTLLHFLSELPPRPAGSVAEGFPAGLPGVLVVPTSAEAPAQAALLEQLSPGAAVVSLRTAAQSTGGATWGQNPADLMMRMLGRTSVRCVGLLEGEEATWRTTVLRYFGEVDAWAIRAGSGEEAAVRWKAIEPWAVTLPRPTRWGILAPRDGRLPAPVGPPFSFAVLDGAARPPQGLEAWRVKDLVEGEPTRRDLRAFSLEVLKDLLAGLPVLLRLDASLGGILRQDGAVRPEFLAWRTLSHVLRGARSLGPIPLGPGVEAYALRQGTQTVMVAWASEPGGEAEVFLPTTHPVTAIDLAGGVEILEASGGQVVLKVSDLPRCFLAVSSGWLRTRTTMHLDRGVTASRRPSACVLSFENGFDLPLLGTLRLSPPPGWRVSPETLSVTLAPGERFSAAVEIVPAPYEVTGRGEGRERRLEAVLDFADGRLAPMAASVPLRFMPEGLDSRVSTAYQPEGERILVLQEVANRSDKPVLCDAFLSAKGGPERRVPLGRLAPGEVRHVRYLLPWQEALQGEALVGIRELEGARRFVIGGLRGE